MIADGIDPAIRGLLGLLATQPPMSAGTVAQARAGFRTLTVEMRAPETMASVWTLEPLEVDGADGPLAAKLLRPDVDGPVPTVVFFHGGGFVIGDLDTHEAQARQLCRDAEVAVLMVDYRLGPEHPFPAAPRDALAATRWAAAHIAELGGDPSRLAVAGDSAGGNLAAGVALACRQRGEPQLAAQFLVYPATDFGDGLYPSRANCAEGCFLTLDDMTWFAGHYAGSADRSDPRLSPLLAPDLSGLPPAVVVVAEFDPLHDDGVAYARALRAAGVDVQLLDEPGMTHGFFDLGPLSPAAAIAIDRDIAAFAALLRR